MTYHQITSSERYMIATLHGRGYSCGAIADLLGRHRSTIGRELRRNASPDGFYRAVTAIEHTRARRSRSRRNSQFDAAAWARVEALLAEQWSPEQIAGYLHRHAELHISHETIYRHIWRDWRRGGDLYRHLRGARKQRRKRYGRYDSRGRLGGKRLIGERPAACELRSTVGHWEIDTVLGTGSRHGLVSLVDRKTGFLALGKIAARTTRETSRRTIALLRRHPRPGATVTADNGTEFHDYARIERATAVVFYFATPHHAWERGTNENTNGLLRQYAPKGVDLAGWTQADCDRIARHLNNRPRKRLGYRTPAECFDAE